ncbi:MAG: secondary thiamine-phosphate synthase enzyme YjbQ [Deltaproteobacteria bacterium]|nr:secondary thiamine-phosphate synthase enzyme YjbQ [Deltaproteobacteria bacterium]
MTLKRFTLNTASKEGLYPITEQVREAVGQSQAHSGLAVVFCPHTTAGITINENADPAVGRDLLKGLGVAFPDQRSFEHLEGNSAAHLKALAVGSEVNVIIENGSLLLGVWQGIYFGEFDGPRSRTFFVKVMKD